MNIIYEAVIGSRLKGIHNPDSDTDYMGIYVAKNSEIGGFEWNDSKNTFTDASPEGDDHTYYEIRRFFRLASYSSPVLLPFIASPIVISYEDVGIGALRIARESLISEKFLRKNSEFVRGRIEVFKKRGGIKNIIEAFYIGELTCRWLSDGYLTNPSLTHDTHYSGWSFKEFMGLRDEYQETELLTLADFCETITASPNLRAEPDIDRASQFLTYVRNNHG
jgi:predicted nucleotidyltransferase